jgi:hypothetical protein
VSFPVDDQLLGPASFGKRKGHEGIIFHTTEASGPSRAHAVGTANWQKTNPGSYGFIVYDNAAGSLPGLLLTVPYLEASGGVNPASRSWLPKPWLSKLLTPAAFKDPNAYLMNVAFSGRAMDLAAGKYPPNMIDTAARLLVWFEDTFSVDAVVCSHSDWQTNRTDPGAGVVDRILARYTEVRDMARFTDVPQDHPFRGDIEWAAQQGITKGIKNPDGTFRFEPDRPVTRAEVMAFLRRASEDE